MARPSAAAGPANSNAVLLANQPCVNSATGPFSTVAGGYDNITSGYYSAIAGGASNHASGDLSTIGGGAANGVGGYAATVSGGSLNSATGDYAFVGGGRGNTASGTGSTVGGGGTFVPSNCGPTAELPCVNSAVGSYATVAGGFYSRALQDYDTVGGGSENSATGGFSTVAGGLRSTAGGGYSFVGGGDMNSATGFHSTVAGGFSNMASGDYSFVGGGEYNNASGTFAAIGSGAVNTAGGDSSYAAGGGATVQNAAEAGSAADCADNYACGDFLTFVWSDGVQFKSTGPRQFLIHATGGVAINTTPPNDFIELTIAGSGNNGDFANAFLRQASTNRDILISSGGATSTANNDVDVLDRSLQRHGAGTRPCDRRERRLHDLQRQRDQADRHDLVESFGWATEARRAAAGAHARSCPAASRRDVRVRHPDNCLHPAGRHTGFIAQEVQQVFPDWIGATPDGYLTVGPNGFEALTVEALRDLRAEKDAEIGLLQDKLDAAVGTSAAMQARLDELSTRLSKLEAGRER